MDRIYRGAKLMVRWTDSDGEECAYEFYKLTRSMMDYLELFEELDNDVGIIECEDIIREFAMEWVKFVQAERKDAEDEGY